MFAEEELVLRIFVSNKQTTAGPALARRRVRAAIATPFSSAAVHEPQSENRRHGSGPRLAAGIVAVAGIGAKTLQTLKVNGPIYKEIVDGKDLIADILPPPLYLIESYALANETVLHPDTAGVNIPRFDALQKAYQERRDYWKTSTLPNDLQAQLYDKVLTKGDVYWSTLRDDYLPALQANDESATKSALTRLKTEFHDPTSLRQ